MKTRRRNILCALLLTVSLIFVSFGDIAKADGSVGIETEIKLYVGYVDSMERDLEIAQFLDNKDKGVNIYFSVGLSITNEQVYTGCINAGFDCYGAVHVLDKSNTLRVWSYDLTPDMNSVAFTAYAVNVDSLIFEGSGEEAIVVGYKTLSGDICPLPTFAQIKEIVGVNNSLLPEPSYGPLPKVTTPPSSTQIPSVSPDESDKKDKSGTLLKRNTKAESASGETYTVTKTGEKDGEVAYTLPKNKRVALVTVPATVKLKGIAYRVTSIKAGAFKKCKNLQKVTIGKNIKRIGMKAFYGCKRLKKITVKATGLTLQGIGNKAFGKIHAKVQIKVPRSRQKKYKKLFRKCGLTGKRQIVKW